MAVIKSGATSDQLTIDATSKAARVSPYNSLGREVAPASKATFAFSATFTPAATPTDLVTLYGSASKIVRVVAMLIGTTNTAAGSQQFLLIKRSAANTTGTFVAGTAVSLDTTDGASPTAVVGHYTANPGGLGAGVTINTVRAASPAAIPASWAGIREVSLVDLLDHLHEAGPSKPVTLSGTSQGLAINFAGAALVAGQTHTYTVVWTEE